jgi:hypothetical protein
VDSEVTSPDANYLQNFPRQKLLDPVNAVGDPFFFRIQDNYAFCNSTIEISGQCPEGGWGGGWGWNGRIVPGDITIADIYFMLGKK